MKHSIALLLEILQLCLHTLSNLCRLIALRRIIEFLQQSLKHALMLQQTLTQEAGRVCLFFHSIDASFYLPDRRGHLKETSLLSEAAIGQCTCTHLCERGTLFWDAVFKGFSCH